ncbi:ATP-dependent DNA helicase, partial [Xylella fastidiosa subsp. multiplex]|nr:ATP-dependent DNA helicase [Xylella fastidiosa subsp. multiplex]
VQGDAPRATLLDRFRVSGNGLLLGSASLREGVDVAGEALSVVVIDKLPFTAPDDPVFEERLEAIRQEGGNPFFDEQLPQAVI